MSAAGESDPGGAAATPLAAIVLAAGSSRRFGSDNKLLADLAGKPLLARVLEPLVALKFSPLIVVTGHERQRIENALAGYRVSFVHNERHGEGMGGSVARGIASLPHGCPGALITPGDLPGIDAPLLNTLCAAFRSSGGSKIVFAALADGTQRNPVLWPARFFAQLAGLAGDTGARAIIAAHPGDVLPVVAASEAMLADIDRRADLEHWRGRATTGDA